MGPSRDTHKSLVDLKWMLGDFWVVPYFWKAPYINLRASKRLPKNTWNDDDDDDDDDDAGDDDDDSCHISIPRFQLQFNNFLSMVGC